MSGWPFGDLHPFSYGIIMADPPWLFENYSKKGEGRNATAHYDCMATADIAALPVEYLASRHCALFLWGTSPLLPDVLVVMRAWGFRFAGKAFCWAKATRKGVETPFKPIGDNQNWQIGLGYSTRANTEDCWLGIMGQPERLDRGVRELIVSPAREHSRKPDEAYERATRLYPGPALELFARERRAGWAAWGNETGKFENAYATD